MSLSKESLLNSNFSVIFRTVIKLRDLFASKTFELIHLFISKCLLWPDYLTMSVPSLLLLVVAASIGEVSGCEDIFDCDGWSGKGFCCKSFSQNYCCDIDEASSTETTYTFGIIGIVSIV